MNGRPVNLNKSKKEINFMKYQISMAPMEGLTGYVYRRAHHAYFAPLDTYYTPFISNKKLGSRERHDVLPEHNEGRKTKLCILRKQEVCTIQVWTVHI